MSDYLFKGIDVSKYQGSIDFKKVKEDGYNFVIIKIGYGRLSSQIDNKFEEHYKGAKEAGLEIGGYWYSYATSPEEGIQEAKACLDIIKNKKFSYPIFYDVEETKILSSMSRASLTKMVNNFCSTLKNSSYIPGLYTFASALIHFDLSQIPYEKWLAKWGKNMYPYNTSQFSMWQYGIIGNGNQSTITGKVKGCDNCDDVDVDYAYKDFTSLTGISFSGNKATKPINETPKQNTNTTTIKTGSSIKLSNTSVYASAGNSRASFSKSGIYYIYSSEVINNRIRITNSPSNVGKTPIGNYVTGWINVKDVSLSNSSVSTSNTVKSYTAGTKITLNKASLYTTDKDKNAVSVKTGTYYIYSSSISNNRIRITNSPSNVGKTPIGNYVTGWINIKDIK